MYQLYSALYYMHKQKIIHRDLKPGNIMLREINPDGHYFCSKYQVVLIDFGLCAASDDFSAHSFLHDRSGTVGYLAPELIEKDNAEFYNEKVDIYSAGIVFVEL